MNIDWKPTNVYYHAIINQPALDQKKQLYQAYFLEPWKPMMNMMAGMSSDPEDEFGVARAWGWYLPGELDQVPAVLRQLESAGAWDRGQDALMRGVDAFAGYELPFDHVEGWLIAGAQERNRANGNGYTGAIDFTAPRFICQYFQTNDRNIRALPGAVVHEFNHLIRLRVFPWDMANTNVGDYIIHEGLAESFATALFGEEALGYYVTDISDNDLQVAKTLIKNNLDARGFNTIRGYIFGDHMAEEWGFDAIGMPAFGGYAVGYHVVQAFLRRTGSTIQDATFLPAERIIADSGYFA